MNTKKFRTLIYDYYAANRRTFSWRDEISPYRVVISEIMLQQTQTFRVAEKFEPFVTVFPTFQALAQAPFALVLALWKGLGYNRRARYVQQIAQKVVNDCAGVLPDDVQLLEAFSGLGKATARSIVVFAYNKPEVFIETNIRAVFIHHFFAGEYVVADSALVPLVSKTLDRAQPREWYYALMDYGVMLKKQFKNPARRSAHHVVQSRFEGSNRQLRGKILELLLKHKRLHKDELYALLIAGCSFERFNGVLDQLVLERFIKQVDGCLVL